MQEVIYVQTGSYTRLLRFCGGSATIGYHNKELSRPLVNSAVAKGYQFFDWNISSGDGSWTNTTDSVRSSVIAGVQQFNLSVVLQHDNRDFSVAAVESIIQWGLANGYTFARLELDSFAPQQVLPK